MRGALLMAGWAMLALPSVIGAAEPGPVMLGTGELATIGRRVEPPPALPEPPPESEPESALMVPSAPPDPSPPIALAPPAPLVIVPSNPPLPAVVERPATVPERSVPEPSAPLASELGSDELGAIGRRVPPAPLPAAAPVAVAAPVELPAPAEVPAAAAPVDVPAPVTVAAVLPPAFARPAPRPIVATVAEPPAGPILLDAQGLSLIGP